MKQSRKTRQQLIEELEAIKTKMGLPADKEPGKDYGNSDLSGYMGLFRAITESMLDAMVIIDWQGDIRYANSAAFNLVGIPEDTPLDSLNIFQFVHPDSAQEVEEDLSLVSRGTDSFVAVYKLITGDGSQRWVETLGRKIIFESGQADLVTIRDVTRRKLAEEELKARQARLDSIFRAVPTGIGVVADRVLLEVNDRICQMTGYSREELIGKSARMLYPTLEDYDYVGREKYDQIRKTGTGSVETRWRRKDGSIIDIILSSTPIDP
nr:PAS domain-containing protein [Deltaproteobacteria bacterium]